MSKRRQATLDDLKALADGGLSANQIATRLNNADLANPTGSRWYDSSVLFQFAQNYRDCELAQSYPQLAEDAKKYAAKQAAKKAKARARKVLVKSQRVATESPPQPEAGGYAVVWVDDGKGCVAVYPDHAAAVAKLLECPAGALMGPGAAIADLLLQTGVSCFQRRE